MKGRFYMEYYAIGTGDVVYDRVLTEEECNAIWAVLILSPYESDVVVDWRSTMNAEPQTLVTLYCDDKYHDDEVLYTLNRISEATGANIQEGEVHYSGEDGALWRFVFKNGQWIMENAVIRWESDEPVSYDRLKDAFVEYVTNDFEAAGPEYVESALLNAGLTAEDIDALGLNPAE